MPARAATQTRSPPRPSPSLARILSRPTSVAAVERARRYAASRTIVALPPSNSRHVKAIPGILLIVMQSRPAQTERDHNFRRGAGNADAPSVLFPLMHVTYAAATRVARTQAGRCARHSAAIAGIFASIEAIGEGTRFDAVEIL